VHRPQDDVETGKPEIKFLTRRKNRENRGARGEGSVVVLCTALDPVPREAPFFLSPRSPWFSLFFLRVKNLVSYFLARGNINVA
jgi:hypothetical protein